MIKINIPNLLPEQHGIVQSIHSLQVRSQNTRVVFSIHGVPRVRVEDKRTSWGGRRKREAAGFLPCLLSVTFFVNSSYDFFPPLSFHWEEEKEEEKAETNFCAATSPHFISASPPFL